jgi:hypothetical protein
LYEVVPPILLAGGKVNGSNIETWIW